jgi:hypothetical protein
MKILAVVLIFTVTLVAIHHLPSFDNLIRKIHGR